MTALSRVSKAGTVFLCEPAGAGAAACAVDVGELRTNLTDPGTGTYVYELNSARTAISKPRSITVIVDLTSSSSGVIVMQGSTVSAYGWLVQKSAANIRVAQNGSLLLTVGALGLVGTARKCLIHWATRTDDSSVLSELWIYNFTTGQWAYGRTTHSSYTPLTTDKFVIGATPTGTSAYSLGLSAYHLVHVGQRYKSSTEASIDHVTTPSPPAMPGRRRTPRLTGTSSALTIASDGAFCGPSYLWALAATRDADSRLITPLVNVLVANPYTEVEAPTSRYNRNAPGSTVFRLSTRWLWHAWPGDKVNAARVRIHVAVTSTGTVCPIHFRMYSIANLSMGQDKPPPLLSYSTSTVTISSDTGAAGVWLDLGQVRLARDDSGMTALALALNWNDGLGDLYTTSVVIRSVTVEPLSADLSSGGFGDIDDKKGA